MRHARSQPTRYGGGSRGLAVAGLLLMHPVLLLVDHVHFQYNGALSGVQLAAVLLADSRGSEHPHAYRCRGALAALAFAALVNLKHLYVYAAPVYAAQLLVGYVLGGVGIGARLRRAAACAGVVVGMAAVSVGPLLVAGGAGALRAMVSRLFPFGRGLLHAFWAPNAWALYAAADKTLATAARLVGAGAGVAGAGAGLTGGLVGEGAGGFAMLPGVPPAVALACVLLAVAPAVAALALRARVDGGGWRAFGRAVAFANLSGVMFGYHVHEKALITVLVPMVVDGLHCDWGSRAFVLLSGVACASCATLLHAPREAPLRACLLAASLVCVPAAVRAARGGAPVPLAAHERAYLLGLAAVEAYAQVGHAALFGAGVLPFAPLMLVSVYGALGVSYVWAAEAAHHSLASVYRIIEVTCVSATDEVGHSSDVRALGPGKRARHRAHMPPCMVVGCRVRKRFLDGKLYAGTVVDVAPADPFPVTVEYEDGDVESYSVEDVRDQLELYLPPGMVVGRRVRKRFEDGKLYAGRVVDVSPADRFPVTVKYDDGDVESYSVEDAREQLELR